MKKGVKSDRSSTGEKTGDTGSRFALGGTVSDKISKAPGGQYMLN